MDFSHIIPREYHATCILIGQTNCFKIDDRDNKTEVLTDLKSLMLLPSDYQKNIIKLLKGTKSETDSLHLLSIDAISAAIAEGPKIFRPTTEQYNIMQDVDIDIPISEYSQPYPSMIIDLPRNGMITLANKVGLPIDNLPSWAIVRNRKTIHDKNFVYISHHFQKSDSDVAYAFQDRPEFTSIEDVLKIWVTCKEDDKKEQKFTEISSRAIINFMLLLTNYGHKIGGPLEPKQYAKHRKNKIEKFMHADFLTVEMKQSIVIKNNIRTNHGDEPIPNGIEMAPHWRRGHWRIQKCGAGNLKTKLIFIERTLVRPDRIIGSLSDSNVELAIK